MARHTDDLLTLAVAHRDLCTALLHELVATRELDGHLHLPAGEEEENVFSSRTPGRLYWTSCRI